MPSERVSEDGPIQEQLEEIADARQRVREDPWGENERAAKQRIHEDAQRPLGVNLAEQLALCAFAIKLRDAGRLSFAKKRA